MNPVLLFLVSFGLLLTGCTNTNGPHKNETSAEYGIPPLMEYEYNKAKDEGTYEEYFSWYEAGQDKAAEIIMRNATKIELFRCFDRNNNTIYRLIKGSEERGSSEVDYYSGYGIFLSKESVTCGGFDCSIHQMSIIPPPNLDWSGASHPCVKIREDMVER